MDSKKIYLLSGLNLLNSMIFGIIFVIIPFVFKSMGVQATDYSIFISLFSVTSLVLTPFWGQLSDKYGRIRILVLQYLGHALSLILMTLAWNPMSLLACAVVAGFFSAGPVIIGVCGSDLTSDDKRTKALGILGAGFTIGTFIIGPVLASIISHWNIRGPLVFEAIMCVMAASIAYVFLRNDSVLNTPSHKKPTGDQTNIKETLKKALSIPKVKGTIIVYFLGGLGGGAMNACFGFMMNARFGIDEKQLGGFLGAFGIVSALVQFFFAGKANKYISDFKLLPVLISLQAINILIVIFTPVWQGVLLTSILSGVIQGIYAPLVLSILSRNSAKGTEGLTLGIYAASGSLATILIAPFAGMLYDNISIYSHLWFAFSMEIIIMTFLLMYKWDKPVPTSD